MTTRRSPVVNVSVVPDQYPTLVSYSLDDEQLSAITASLAAGDMGPRNLDNVPEEDGSTTEGGGGTASPYLNPSAADSSSTFHNGTNPPPTPNIPGATPPTGQQPAPTRPRKAPSVRTLGRPSNDHLQGTSTSGNVRRTTSAVSSSSKSARVSAGGQVLPRYRSTPRLPQDKDVPAAPATGMYWSKAPAWGHLPGRTLRAHTVTLVDNVAWIFGGSDDRDTSKDIYCFDTETMQWTHPDTVGDVSPPPCRAHTATLVDRKIVIYGGGLGGIYYDTVFILDTTTRRWLQPPIHDGDQPTGRRAHSAVYYKGRIWVFGGGNGLTALNDVWTMELGPNQAGVTLTTDGEKALKWEEQHTTGRKPGPRGYHSATLVGDVMVVVGGSDGKECFTDIWLLNLETLVWSMVKQQAPVYKRLSHSATQVGSYLFVIAGHNGAEYCSEILMLNLVSLQYEPRTIYGKPPSMRGNHATVLSDSRVFLFGGFNGQQGFDDVHILDLAAGAYLPQVTSFEIEAI
ncbi:galactose oxidase [Coprinopsis marcescibilis]|uniref:Galactose oxidase n=1 Tax=Coprinopsis marcescibilis TaxID=230819 RepID=A0A5C3L8T2_COPMA|nr:galactose oxidase [Coprinopsis marcescibilis]